MPAILARTAQFGNPWLDANNPSLVARLGFDTYPVPGDHDVPLGRREILQHPSDRASKNRSIIELDNRFESMDPNHAAFYRRIRGIDLDGMVRVAVLGLDQISLDGTVTRQIPFAGDPLGILCVDFVLGVGVFFRQTSLTPLPLMPFAKFDSGFI